MSDLYARRLEIYDRMVAACPEIDRKGKTMPYTSTQGHMFSLLNKAGEIGLRLGKDGMADFIKAHGGEQFRSYGANMRGYVRVPDDMLSNLDLLADYLRQAKAHVETLPPK